MHELYRLRVLRWLTLTSESLGIVKEVGVDCHLDCMLELQMLEKYKRQVVGLKR